MEDLLLRDRFLFATRRRLLASLPKVVTTAAASFQVAYGFQAKMLPTANGTMLIGVTASDDCDVKVTTSYGAVTLTTGGLGCIIDRITGIPVSTWFGITVEVKSNSGSPVTIYGINMQESILDAADLP
jgi:aspartate oxidase